MSKTRLPGFTGLAVAALLVFAALVNAQTAPEIFERARMLDESNQNLLEAIKLYSQVVNQADDQRGLAARAQYRIGVLYERLGRKAEAQRAYQAVVNNYTDQSDVASQARARIVKTNPTPKNNTSVRTVSPDALAVRQVWETRNDSRGFGSVSPDGRYLSFHDWETGALFLRDLATGKDRRLTRTRNGDAYPGSSTFSPDGKQIAYAWNDNGRHELRVISVNGTGFSAPRVLFENVDKPRIGSVSVRARAWSHDGKWIAVEIQRPDSTKQIALISPHDRSVRMLKSLSWRSLGLMFFSPDSRYLAFHLPPDQTSEKHDVFALAVDGSREIPVAVHPANDFLLGWTPDGKHILIGSDRTGSTDLWAIPFQNGTTGVPELVKRNLGEVQSMGVTPFGALYFRLWAKGPDLYTASVDFESGRILANPTVLEQALVASGQQISWSHDGKYVMYKVHNRLAIRSVETGDTRYLEPDLTYWYAGGWSPNGQFNLTQGTDRKGRQGIFLINLQTGGVQTIAVNPPHISYWPQWSKDGTRIFYAYASQGSPAVVVEYHIDSGKEREIFRSGREGLGWWSVAGNKLFYGFGSAAFERDIESGSDSDLLKEGSVWVSASPDRNYLILAATEPITKESTLSVRPLDGGEPRELLRLKSSERFRPQLRWTPDSRAVLYQTMSSSSKQKSEIWCVSIAGGPPRKIDLGFDDVTDLRIHPDGRQIVFRTTITANQVWVLENFLPASQSRKATVSTR